MKDLYGASIKYDARSQSISDDISHILPILFIVLSFPSRSYSRSVSCVSASWDSGRGW